MKKKPGSKASSAVGSSRQSKLNASPKQTGGGGGIYEEKAIAYFLAHMLAGQEPLLRPSGTITRIDTQRASELYPLDDVLLEVTAQGRPRRVACSIKSNQQFTKQGFPSDFVRKAWEQLLIPTDTLFDSDNDYIGFVTAPIAPGYTQQLSELLQQARQQNPETLAEEIKLSGRSNAQARALYDSFECPPDLVSRFAAEKTRTGYGLSRLIWLSFDFEQLESKDEHTVLRLAQRALVSPKADEARRLWTVLRSIASTLRQHAGSRTTPQLVDELRYEFELAGFPDYRIDWKRLRAAAESTARQVSTQIGGRVTLARTEKISEVRTAMETGRIVVLRGPSGAGKSALARLEYLARGSEEPLLWLDAEHLRGKSLLSLHNEWGLTHSLPELLANTTSARGLCVIDRLDKLYEENSITVFSLLAELAEAFRISAPSTAWRILLPCVTEECDRIEQALHRQGINNSLLKSIWVDSPTHWEQQQIWDAFPHLASLGTRAHLREVLLRPKILDTLAYALSADDQLDRVLGESVVATLWLDKLVQQPNGVQQRACAEELATLQADTLQNTLPYTELPSLHLTAVDDLIESRICVKRKQQPGVSFEHDLYGDWLRLQKIRHEADRGKLLTFMQAEHRIGSPSWHRAIRLYGATLLDENPSPAHWVKLFEQFGSFETGEAAQDSLLEATWYAAEPLKNFLALWDLLAADSGRLLHRLLVRFQYTATRPNERIIDFVKSEMPESAIYAPTWYRLPLLSEWIPMIELLYAKHAELPVMAWQEIAAVVDRWLQIVPIGGYADWAASVAISLGDALLKTRKPNYRLRDDSTTQKIYTAVLAATRLEPDAAARILREGAGLGIEIPETKVEIDENHSLSGFRHYSPPRPRWAEGGPTRPVDEALQKVAIENNLGLVDLIKWQPGLALELATALLIEEPKSREHDSFSITYGLEHFAKWPAAFYQNGPFLSFLEYNESQGVELILRLERRALAGWREERIGKRRENWTAFKPEDESSNESEAPGMWLDLPTSSRWITGDESVYGWHRGVFPSSDVMTSALMALEKYLYDRLDKGMDVTVLLDFLLQEASSTAILGTLVLVGKRNSELLTGTLLPLLGSPELLFWDNLSIGRSDTNLGAFWWEVPPKQLEALQEWRKLPHRDYPLQHYVNTYFFQYDAGKHFIAAARLRWQERALKSQMPEYYDRTIHYYNIDNHKFTKTEEGILIEYQESEEKRLERAQHEKSQRLNLLLLSRITKENLLKDSSAPLTDEQLVTLWDEVLYLQELDEETRAMAWQTDKFADVLMGNAAIFLLRGRIWLTQRAEIETWTRELLLEGAQLIWDERNAEKDEFSEYTVDWAWQSFLAQALPALWAEELTNPDVRQAIGQIALVATREAVKHLMEQVAVQRNTSSVDESTRLAHLLVLRAHWESECSSVKYNARRIDSAESETAVIDSINELLERRDKWLLAFVAGTLSSTVPELSTLSKPPELRSQGARRPDPEWPSFNPNVLIAAFCGIPTPIEEVNYFPFWQATLRSTLQRLQPADGNTTGELGGSPNDWDTWLFQRLANWLPLLSRTEAQQLWEPILTLGGWARSWVLRFLNSWTRVAFSEASNLSVATVWCDMINYCLTCSGWNPSGRNWHSAELWRNLLSLDWQTSWKPEHAHILTAISSLLNEWLKIGWKDGHALSSLAAILARVADESMLSRGLQWLMIPALQLEATDEYWKDLEGELAILLVRIWHHHQAMIRQDEQAFSAFRKLMMILVARQHKLGLELSHAVGQA